MGGITDPVDGSGSHPAWIARVSKPDFSAVLLGHPASVSTAARPTLAR